MKNILMLFIPLISILIIMIGFLLRKKGIILKILMGFGVSLLMLSLLVYSFMKPSEDKTSPNNNFSDRYESMMKVVKLIEDEKLLPKPNEDISKRLGDRIILPKEFKALSSGGEVIYQKKDNVTSILFITSTDMFGEHYYGYLYRSNGQPPIQEDFYESIGFKQRLSDYWFTK
jgi:hypothetical protein